MYRALNFIYEYVVEMEYRKTNRATIFEERNFLPVVNKFEFAKLNSLHDEIEECYVLSAIFINIRVALHTNKFRSSF